MKLIGEGKDSKLVDNSGNPIFFSDEVSEAAFLRARYNNCLLESRKLEAKENWAAIKNEMDVINKYINDHDIDYGEVDPETGLLVEKQNRR